MKKKIVTFLGMMIVAVSCLCVSAFAEEKPAVEIMYFKYTSYSDGGIAPTIYFRNNTSKTIKYLEFNTTAYNRVGDEEADWATGEATKLLKGIGPLEPHVLNTDTGYDLLVRKNVSDDCPFKFYRGTPYTIAIGNEMRDVYQDIYGNFFVCYDEGDWCSGTYLTDDEIENAMFYQRIDFKSCWYNRFIDKLVIDKIIITYMDGTTETVTKMDSKYRGMQLEEIPFEQETQILENVYNYKDYLNYNPDLLEIFGMNQKALFEHFITNGMQEGRRGSKEFDVAIYKEENPDVVEELGEDNMSYYFHYQFVGKDEERKAA